MFDKMLQNIDKDTTVFLLKAEIRQNIERKPAAETKKMSTNKDDSSDKTKNNPANSKTGGRNDLCPCGSVKKYKQCCGK